MHQAFRLENSELPRVPFPGSVHFLTQDNLLLRKPRLNGFEFCIP